MKTRLIVISMLALATSVSAQESAAINKEKMKLFSSWVGRWQGEGVVQTGKGESRKSQVDERIQAKLDDTILLVEGVGKSKDEQTGQELIVHHAMAVLYYDEPTAEYKFKTFLKTGKNTDAWFKVIAENNYQWGFQAPNAHIRYTITINPREGTWHETGEFSREGATWMKIFEMNLKKTE